MPLPTAVNCSYAMGARARKHACMGRVQPPAILLASRRAARPPRAITREGGGGFW
jgi:hypothetical protein